MSNSILIQGGQLLTLDGANGTLPISADVLISDDTIAAVGRGLRAPENAHVINATDRLVMPGLVNAHLHSWEALVKGRYENLPLEMWIPYAYPPLGIEPLSPRMIYLRTMLVGIESLRNGVTCVLDDILELPDQTPEALGAAFQAYEDLGIRANCSGHIADKSFPDTLPSLDLPPELIKQLPTPPTADEYFALTRQAFDTWHGKAGRLRYVVAPSAPQRCSPELLQGSMQFAHEHDATYHIHVLETQTQEATAREFYGKTMVEQMSDLDLLTDRTTIAHSIWVTDNDIRLLAEAGCSVAHNPVSNLKLGSGIAPWRKLLNAGVTVALGTDGISTNDSARMFDVMRFAGLIHNVTDPDYNTWPTATEVLAAATRGGARSVRLEDQIGVIREGAKADLLLLRLDTPAFTPLNDIHNHLVYCENGESLDRVIVNGEVVFEDNRLTRIDEQALLAELRAEMPAFLERQDKLERLNAVFQPYLDRMYRRCTDCQHTEPHAPHTKGSTT